MVRVGLTFGALFGLLATAPAAELGERVPATGSLRDLRGNSRPLDGFKDTKAIVVAFVGADCPISNLYLPGLVELEKAYRAKGVQFLAVYPNERETTDRVAGHAYDRDVPFLVLKDFGQKLASALSVERVPTVAVLDGEYKLRYRGRIDDRYGANARRPKATREDLKEALDEVLAGKAVSVPKTEADGCLIDRGEAAEKKAVTFHKDVEPILQKRCQMCHRPEQTAPFTLLSYDDAAKHARQIKEVTSQRRMPPWHPDPRYGHFSNDRRMTAAEIDAVSAWVDAGAPRGDTKDAPRPIEWPTGWVHGKPDLVLNMPEEFEVPATGSLPYKHYTLDPGFTEDKWVTIAEGRPGSASVVHHLVVYILRPGQPQPFQADGTLSVLVGWAPGDLGLVCPPDTALRIPKGAKLRFEMHYTPNGTKTKDRSTVGLTFAKAPPKRELFFNSFANETILLPPHDPHYRAEAVMKLRADAQLLGFGPHMHWRGKDYFYEIVYADGHKEPLLSVPRWDFNWQNIYWFTEPVKLPKGARLHAVAHWDNSTNNLYNPAPDKQVAFGLQTWDEMMVGWVAYVWERPETAEELAKNPISQADMIFDRIDRNGDEVITPDEIPEQLKPLMAAAGVKMPEKMTRAEFTKMFNELTQRFRRPRPPVGDKKP